MPNWCSPSQILSETVSRYGVLHRRDSFHCWAHGEAIGEFERAAALLRELVRRHPRHRLLLTARASATRHWLRHHFPDAHVLPPPVSSEYCLRRVFTRMRVHALLLLERPHDDLGKTVFRVARWWRFPVVVVNGGEDLVRDVARLSVADHVLTRFDGVGLALCAAGCPPDQVTVAVDDEAALATLAQLLQRDWSTLGRGAPVGLSQWWRRLLASPPGRAVLALRSEPITDLAMLRTALGGCANLLCLGNGPSSEDPRVKDVTFDALFRVNWRWRGRGRLERPHVVFTGDGRFPRDVGSPILGYRTIEEERRLLRRRLLAAYPRTFRYFTIERLAGVSINERHWPARPTNGAGMIATAVALEPRRLTIAGVDLYEHPDGAYPDERTTANSYPLIHARETELAIMAMALRRFRGELVVLSDPLARALRSAGLR